MPPWCACRRYCGCRLHAKNLTVFRFQERDPTAFWLPRSRSLFHRRMLEPVATVSELPAHASWSCLLRLLPTHTIHIHSHIIDTQTHHGASAGVKSSWLSVFALEPSDYYPWKSRALTLTNMHAPPTPSCFPPIHTYTHTASGSLLGLAPVGGPRRRGCTLVFTAARSITTGERSTRPWQASTRCRQRASSKS